MIYRTLRLTWRKALLMVAVYVGLLGAHFAVAGLMHVDEPVLFLAAALLVPLWAISAAVYTFDNLTFPHDRGWRRPV